MPTNSAVIADTLDIVGKAIDVEDVRTFVDPDSALWLAVGSFCPASTVPVPAEIGFSEGDGDHMPQPRWDVAVAPGTDVHLVRLEWLNEPGFGVSPHVGHRVSFSSSRLVWRRMDLPPPPYWAVVFTAQRNDRDEVGYSAMAEAMEDLAAEQPGYLGFESARGADGLGIAVSYWTDEAAIAAWKSNVAHRAAQRSGIETWYEHYDLRVARVERAYSGPRELS